MGRYSGKWSRKIDSTQTAVVAAFKASGWSVLHTARLGGSAPDLVVCRAGRWLAVEVKGPKTRISDGQSEWLAAWPGETAIVRSVKDVEMITQTIDMDPFR